MWFAPVDDMRLGYSPVDGTHARLHLGPHAAFQIRQDCDYEDFFIAAKQDAEAQYFHAAELLDAIREYLDAEEDS